MLDAIIDRTPTAVRGWFALGLAISRDAQDRFALEGLSGRLDDREAALRAISERARAIDSNAPLAGDLLAGAVLHSVLRYIVGDACARLGEGGIDALADAYRARAGEGALDEALSAFAELYPPADGQMDGRRALVELLLLSVAESNRAMDGLRLIFADARLQKRVPVDRVVEAAEAVFVGRGSGASAPTLVQQLHAPLEAHPDDLGGQLDFVLDAWGDRLPGELHARLVDARDLLAEERRPRFSGPGPAQPITFAAAEQEVERFTPDRDWMTTVVLIAKLSHVWLDQLSKTYGEAITRLDQIPDAELDRLAEWGVTGLWLIGLWQRSGASATIKRKMGNPEAIASAYALYDYAIADDLGGQPAYEDLRERARRRGIRLAADMVPNHVGIDGRWVIEKPDWFLQVPESPYANYRFTGPDLCGDERVGVYLEDGYWNRSDAAVVFKRVDHATGDARFIYHGNDGTQMPWNDTAQIDYLNPEAREAVIQAILDVARRFSVIRFDAAMTLARKHIRRLWHPAPGDAGAVPSRAAHGVDPATFDAALPHEFWREVVDRIQAEVPDTLLLAEAFWLMEGYFVRTLGMHRVYNSAFMHMLKNEDNAGYRATIANTLAFSPAVLQRFVNFMNNPDEETAIEQFGKGDKYFGVATLLVTLPGLPMVGHGQVEGFAEKYGMEYRRAYKGEAVDADLVDAHERLIFPLMRRRHLFSEADHFALYDVLTPEGVVDENVFAYSNRDGDDRAVVVYNNAYASTRGRFDRSVPINTASGGETHLVTRTLFEALDLDAQALYAFRDHVADLWFLRRGVEFAERGLEVELPGYCTRVFVDFRVMDDPAWHALADALAGGGVPDLDAARRALIIRPVLDAFEAVLDVEMGESVDDSIEPSAAQRFRTLAAPHGMLSDPPTFEEQTHDGSEQVEVVSPVVRLAEILDALTPQGRVDVRPVAIERTDAATVALAEALVEGGRSDDATTIAGDWPSRVSGPAARAWLDVHAHDGIRWFRAERMTALIDAHLAWSGVVDGGALAELIEASAYRFDALVASEGVPDTGV